MVIPNLPTDSLYKFGFVGGLVLVLVSYYILSVKVDSYNNISNELDIQQVTMEAQVTIINQTMNILIDLYNENPNPEQAAVLNKQINQVEKERNSMKIYKEEIEAKTSHFLDSSVQIDRYRNLTYLVMAFGSIVTLLSGFMWYCRLQKFQDLMLALEYKRLIVGK